MNKYLMISLVTVWTTMFSIMACIEYPTSTTIEAMPDRSSYTSARSSRFLLKLINNYNKLWAYPMVTADQSTSEHTKPLFGPTNYTGDKVIALRYDLVALFNFDLHMVTIFNSDLTFLTEISVPKHATAVRITHEAVSYFDRVTKTLNIWQSTPVGINYIQLNSNYINNNIIDMIYYNNSILELVKTAESLQLVHRPLKEQENTYKLTLIQRIPEFDQLKINFDLIQFIRQDQIMILTNDGSVIILDKQEEIQGHDSSWKTAQTLRGPTDIVLIMDAHPSIPQTVLSSKKADWIVRTKLSNSISLLSSTRLLQACGGGCFPGDFCNIASNTCNPCSAVCFSCFSMTLTCNLCDPGYTLSGGSCICPLGTYDTGSTCAPCHSTCSTCTSGGSSDCTTCPSGRTLSGGSCILSCPAGEYYNTATHNCQICTSNCQSCLTLTVCSTCSSGYSKTTAGHCFQCTSSQYFDVNTGCISCDPNCLTCSGLHTNCITCPIGKQLISAHCYNACPTPGTYINIGTDTCIPCTSNCNVCSSTTVCMTCSSGYSKTTAGHCFQCTSSQYFDVNTGCINCDSNCETCMGSPTNCLSCTAVTKQLISAQCYNACPTPGTYINTTTDTCETCTNNCQTCSSLTTCGTCNPGYSKTTAGQCFQCNSSQYFDVSTGCINCDLNCLTCSGSPTNCLSCSTGKQLISAHCYNACPTPGTYINTTTDTCETCTNNCQTCSSLTTCGTCNPGYSKTTAGQCFQCTNSQYFDPNTGCVTCSPNCQACLSTTACGTCSPGYNKTTAGQCLQCNTSQYFDASTGCHDCNANCFTCYGSATNCTSCPIPLVLEYSTGISKLCSPCSPNTFFNVSSCVSCGTNCQTCASTTACMTCSTGFSLTDAGICLKCTSSQYFDPSYGCRDCGTYCLTCDPIAPYSCNSCFAGYILTDSSRADCVDCTAKNQYRFTAGTDTCGNCSIPCASCTGTSTTCTSCENGYFLYQANNSCLATCPQGFGADNSTGTCKPCAPSSCVGCSQSYETCTQCQTPLVPMLGICRDPDASTLKLRSATYSMVKGLSTIKFSAPISSDLESKHLVAYLVDEIEMTTTNLQPYNLELEAYNDILLLQLRSIKLSTMRATLYITSGSNKIIGAELSDGPFKDYPIVVKNIVLESNIETLKEVSEVSTIAVSATTSVAMVALLPVAPRLAELLSIVISTYFCLKIIQVPHYIYAHLVLDMVVEMRSAISIGMPEGLHEWFESKPCDSNQILLDSGIECNLFTNYGDDLFFDYVCALGAVLIVLLYRLIRKYFLKKSKGKKLADYKKENGSDSIANINQEVSLEQAEVIHEPVPNQNKPWIRRKLWKVRRFFRLFVARFAITRLEGDLLVVGIMSFMTLFGGNMSPQLIVGMIQALICLLLMILFILILYRMGKSIAEKIKTVSSESESVCTETSKEISDVIYLKKIPGGYFFDYIYEGCSIPANTSKLFMPILLPARAIVLSFTTVAFVSIPFVQVPLCLIIETVVLVLTIKGNIRVSKFEKLVNISLHSTSVSYIVSCLLLYVLPTEKMRQSVGGIFIAAILCSMMILGVVFAVYETYVTIKECIKMLIKWYKKKSKVSDMNRIPVIKEETAIKQPSIQVESIGIPVNPDVQKDKGVIKVSTVNKKISKPKRLVVKGKSNKASESLSHKVVVGEPKSGTKKRIEEMPKDRAQSPNNPHIIAVPKRLRKPKVVKKGTHATNVKP